LIRSSTFKSKCSHGNCSHGDGIKVGKGEEDFFEKYEKIVGFFFLQFSFLKNTKFSVFFFMVTGGRG